MLLPVLIMSTAAVMTASTCPCKSDHLCKPLTFKPRREIFYWSTNTKNWRNYDWNNKVTTICVFGVWDPELLCYAHARNIRVTFAAFYPTKKLTDSQFRKKWILDLVSLAKKRFADGVNFDNEDPIEKGSIQEKLLTTVVMETADLFHKEIPGSQVTYDVAWSPHCIDKRCYDYKGIANASDFVLVMAYDERGQIFGDCVAGANSGFSQTFKGIKQYLDLGISVDKLVLGLPWYGYDYTCLKLQNDICEIERVPYRGVNCSDAAGRQVLYGGIMKNLVKKAIGGVRMAPDSLSPFFNYKDKDDINHQVWFDNPKSLKLKYDHALNVFKLRGLAIWQVDCLDYSGTPSAKKYNKQMWDALLGE